VGANRVSGGYGALFGKLLLEAVREVSAPDIVKPVP
jgi:hypothetical protein